MRGAWKWSSTGHHCVYSWWQVVPESHLSCDFISHPPPHTPIKPTLTTHQSHWFRAWLKANTQTSPPAAALGETVNYWMYVQTLSHQIHAHQTHSPTGCAFTRNVVKNSRALSAAAPVFTLFSAKVSCECRRLWFQVLKSRPASSSTLFFTALWTFQWSVCAALTAWHLTALVSWPRRVHASPVKNKAGDCAAKLDFHPTV